MLRGQIPGNLFPKLTVVIILLVSLFLTAISTNFQPLLSQSQEKNQTGADCWAAYKAALKRNSDAFWADHKSNDEKRDAALKVAEDARKAVVAGDTAREPEANIAYSKKEFKITSEWYAAGRAIDDRNSKEDKNIHNTLDACLKGLESEECPPEVEGGVLPSAYGLCSPVPKKCASGQQNLDGSCVPSPCPGPKKVTYDKNKPNSDLTDPHINPEMKFHLDEAFKKINVDGGIKVKMKDGTEIIAWPEIHEAYRPPERANKLYQDYVNYQNYKNKPGAPYAPYAGKANKAGETTHEFGMGVDIYLFDQNHKQIEINSNIYGKKDAKTNPNPTYPDAWYTIHKKLNTYMAAEGFEWGEKFGDSPHFEYHPNWQGPQGSNTLPGLTAAAKKQAIKEGNPNGWLQTMWKNAGVECAP